MPGEYSDEDDLEEDELDAVSSPIVPQNKALVPILWIVVICAAVTFVSLLISRVGPAEQITTTRDVANVLTGAYHPGARNSTTVALSENSSGTYSDGECEMTITYEAGDNGHTEFATAVTNTPKCRLAYSVNILGFFEDWSFPDTRITYTTDDPGLPIRSIAFTACRALENGLGMPDCTVVLMDQEYGEG